MKTLIRELTEEELNHVVGGVAKAVVGGAAATGCNYDLTALRSLFVKIAGSFSLPVKEIKAGEYQIAPQAV